MKKEDLVLVFDFLATVLKQDNQEESKVDEQSEPLSYGEYLYNGKYLVKKESEAKEEDKAGYHKGTFITGETVSVTSEPKEFLAEPKPKTPTEIIVEKYNDDVNAIKGIAKEPKDEPKLIKTIKNESARVKQIIDMIENGKTYPFKKKTTPAEDAITRALRDHQQSIAAQLNALESKLRDSLATPEQRRHFKEFVKMENFKAHRDLDRIGYFLDNPGVPNPYEGKDEEPKVVEEDKPKTSEVGDLKVPVLDDVIKKSTVPQIIKDIMVKPNIDFEDLRDQLKNRKAGEPISILTDEVKSNIQQILDTKPKITTRFYDGHNGNMLYE